MLAIRESCEIASIWLLVSNYSSPFSPFSPFQSSPSSSLVNTCYGVSRSSSLSTSFLYQRYASRFPLHIRTRPREYRTYSSYSIRGKSSVVVWASDPISSRVRSINVRIYFTRKIPLIELRLSNHFVSSLEVETFSEEKLLRRSFVPLQIIFGKKTSNWRNRLCNHRFCFFKKETTTIIGSSNGFICSLKKFTRIVDYNIFSSSKDTSSVY